VIGVLHTSRSSHVWKVARGSANSPTTNRRRGHSRVIHPVPRIVPSRAHTCPFRRYICCCSGSERARAPTAAEDADRIPRFVDARSPVERPADRVRVAAEWESLYVAIRWRRRRGLKPWLPACRRTSVARPEAVLAVREISKFADVVMRASRREGRLMTPPRCSTGRSSAPTRFGCRGSPSPRRRRRRRLTCGPGRCCGPPQSSASTRCAGCRGRSCRHPHAFVIADEP